MLIFFNIHLDIYVENLLKQPIAPSNQNKEELTTCLIKKILDEEASNDYKQKKLK